MCLLQAVRALPPARPPQTVSQRPRKEAAADGRGDPDGKAYRPCAGRDVLKPRARSAAQISVYVLWTHGLAVTTQSPPTS